MSDWLHFIGHVLPRRRVVKSFDEKIATMQNSIFLLANLFDHISATVSVPPRGLMSLLFIFSDTSSQQIIIISFILNRFCVLLSL